LGAHPDVYFSQPKEPGFWASDYPEVRRARGFESQAACERLFESAEARRAGRRAEGSTTYLYSRDAVPAIVRRVENPRFIVALRNPVDIVLAFHRTQRLRLNEDEAQFADAWQRSLLGEMPQVQVLDPKLVDYPMVGRIGQAVERLQQVAGKQNVHFVRFEDLRDDPDAMWGALMTFLDLRSDILPDFSIHNSSTRMYRSKTLHRMRMRPPAMLEHSVRRLRQKSLRSNNATFRRAKHALWWQEDPKPNMPPALRTSLTSFFTEDISLLASLTGEDLTAWTTLGPPSS